MSSRATAYGGFWIDRHDFENRLQAKRAAGSIAPEEVDQLRDFRANGFITIKNAVPVRLVDELNDDVRRAWASKSERIKVQTAHGEYKSVQAVPENQILAKLLDVYVYSNAARQASFAERIKRFIHIVFDDEINAFQNLTFQVGSTQSIHKDGAYVVVSEPMKFIASWIAREDIRLGSGELVYYPGSHHFDDFEFAEGRLHWDSAVDGNEIHRTFLTFLHEEAARKNITLERFVCGKGDALIWHPGLAHGGAEIKDPSLTRMSYVTHYCPLTVKPHYFSFAPERAKTRKVSEGCHISSWFYDVGLLESW